MAGNEVAHPADHHDVEHGGDHAAEHHEPVLAPDQLKPPPFKRLTAASALAVMACLPVMAFVGNHEGNVEKVYLVGLAALIGLGGIVRFFLKKAGLRN